MLHISKSIRSENVQLIVYSKNFINDMWDKIKSIFRDEQIFDSVIDSSKNENTSVTSNEVNSNLHTSPKDEAV